MMTPSLIPTARPAYDAFASTYDAFTADYDYERWLSVLHGLAVEHGASGRRLLDVACGTGRSFEPMLRRGYEVTACDISPGWWSVRQHVSRARAGAPRSPTCGGCRTGGHSTSSPCLDDAVNYLHSEVDLNAAFRSVAGACARVGSMYSMSIPLPRTGRCSPAPSPSRRTRSSSTGTGRRRRVSRRVRSAGLGWRSLCQLDLGHPSRSTPLAPAGGRRTPFCRRPGVRRRAGSGHRRGPERPPDEGVHTKVVFVRAQALRKDRSRGRG